MTAYAALKAVHVGCVVLSIALGVYFVSGRRLLGFLERWGSRFWQHLAPLTHRFLPVRRPHHALALGMLWGWLPCGLVYMVLPVAWATASPLQGALVMTVFGLGTAPAMLTVGIGGAGLRTRLRRPLVRRLAGAALIASGLFFLLGPLAMGHGVSGAHEHHHGADGRLTAIKQNSKARGILNRQDHQE